MLNKCLLNFLLRLLFSFIKAGDSGSKTASACLDLCEAEPEEEDWLPCPGSSQGAARRPGGRPIGPESSLLSSGWKTSF